MGSVASGEVFICGLMFALAVSLSDPGPSFKREARNFRLVKLGFGAVAL